MRFLSPKEIREHQLARLERLISAAAATNPFYRSHWAGRPFPSSPWTFESFAQSIPLISKSCLAQDQQTYPPFGTNRTEPEGSYVRCHQTSGTGGQPIRWLDTVDSWSGMVDQWAEVFRAGGVVAEDRVYCAFSFGPFLGFWLAFEAAIRLGCLAVPGGGLSSSARLRAILDTGATVLCCTPTYALRLAEVARSEAIDRTASRVRLIVVAGEPGGSVPAVRSAIEQAWPGARVFDHHGMTEVGPVTYECPAQTGRLHVIESAFLAEILDPSTLRPVAKGEVGELVLTTLNRTASPAIRYRTGDLVRQSIYAASTAGPVCACGRAELGLEGGILGRCDDMMVVRGVNVYPSGVEALIREDTRISEYRVTFHREAAMVEMRVEIEPAEGGIDTAPLAEALQIRFRQRMGLRVDVCVAALGSLPRFEMKARRWIPLAGSAT